MEHVITLWLVMGVISTIPYYIADGIDNIDDVVAYVILTCGGALTFVITVMLICIRSLYVLKKDLQKTLHS